MTTDDDEVTIAARAGHENRGAIEESDRCGCFACLATFRPTAIAAWIKGRTRARETARCPECGSDSVIGSASVARLDDALLRRVRKHVLRY